ncbi:Zinc/iron permease [Calycina marina]|uniref:Zinc/iron permease n=1 Tax=Calycina marina TaxID=1763456 RepID=A0A9P8CIZ2_9HELO|nr:Zinc/iron permease [Calycina marina]
MADVIGYTRTIEYECGSGNEYDGRLGLRVSSIFVIGFGSTLGALLPIAAARIKRFQVPATAFFVTKYFGSGVIIATAFIHLLSPASAALNSPCLTGGFTQYDWAMGVVLITIFAMFFIELMAARCDVFGSHTHDHNKHVNNQDPEVLRSIKISNRRQEKRDESTPRATQTPRTSDHVEIENSQSQLVVPGYLQRPSHSDTSESSSVNEVELHQERSRVCQSVPGRPNDFSYPPRGQDHLSHNRDHDINDDHFAAQMTGIFILEFGVIFHSIFIGLTLAVAGHNFVVLYIVLTFHQTFEGLGLGVRLATADWPPKKYWMPWLLGVAYGFATPIAIAVGIGLRAGLAPGSNRTMEINGVFDAISAGILIYTGLVELMAHEFMFNHEMRKAKMSMVMLAFGCMCQGAGLMALLGKWA